MRVAGNSAEGVLVEVEPDSEELVANYNERVSDSIGIELFAVVEVAVEGKAPVPDVLVPIKNGESIGKGQLLYVRIAVGSGPVKRAERTIILRGRCCESLIQLVIEPSDIQLPKELPITVQATIRQHLGWPMNRTEDINTQKMLLAFLSAYRINGVAGIAEGKKFGNARDERSAVAPAYTEVVRYAFEELGFVRIRIPAKKMFSPNRPMSERFPKTALRQSYESSLRKHLQRYDEVLRNPSWKGKLSYKIWDEPHSKHYPDVVLSYQVAKHLRPDLKLELSEQPDVRLADVADVWTPYITFLKESDIDEQHKRNKEVWVYANMVHGIDHPAYGMRIIGWLLWKYRLDGYLFWAINWWNTDPWTTVSSQARDFMKRGTLVYPGSDGRVYSSLRLEEFRKGIEDFLLLMALDKSAEGEGERAEEAKRFVRQLSRIYNLQERYDNAPNPARYREAIMEIIGVTAHDSLPTSN